VPEVPALPRSRGDGLTPGTDLSARVDQVFAPDGPLASSLDGFEARRGQRDLAAAVARTIETGGTLVAEAGTGTGKTLAYLVPAVLAGRRVLISTGTRNLQDQIFYKDIPALARATGLEIRAAYMKGRTNYLCRHRFDRVVESSLGLPAGDRAWLEHIAEWSGQTDTGDRAEIEDLPDDFALWSDLSATSEQCLGRECPRLADCFITRMRDRAAAAQVVVVNHHLLCADASVRDQAFGEVIPECGVAVIDEAHQLEDVVTQYFGVSLSGYRFEEFVRDATAAIGAVAADQARFAVELMQQANDVQATGRRLFDDVRDEIESRGTGGDRHQVDVATAERLQEPARRLASALRGLAGVAARGTDVPADVATIALRAAALCADLETVLAASDGRFVHFIERRGRGIALRAAPIEVADLVRDSVLSGRHATVLTSATLTVNGDFEYVCGRLGVGDGETLRLASEFDFRTQAVLYLPPGMPDPRSDGFNAAAAWAIGELLERTEGRAFVLFTSYAALRDVHARLARRIRWPLLVQGTAPRPALLRDFRATPHAVLLATSSFWQGVDVAGDALSCVIVDRLPFASPGDPVVAARIAAIGARGGDAFNEYQVPVATLTLLQGLGRLIRSRADRGVMAILDPRLTQKQYGRRFLASLPPAPITDNLRDVERFLGQV
jgi:ATP-dependent DNA helicase DinG